MVISTDILVKTAIEAAFVDLRRNPWILDDTFGALKNDPISRVEYGQKEVQRAKEWFLNQNIPIFLQFRIDEPVFPCITVVSTSAVEDESRASLADAFIETDIDPVTMGMRSVQQRIYDNLNPTAYDPSTGLVSFSDTTNMDALHKGQYLVSSRSGKTYQITKIVSGSQFKIAPNVSDDFNGSFISPVDINWVQYKEVVYTRETVTIGLHAQSNPNESFWLYQIMLYVILRYKEVYLDQRGFELSTFSVDAMARNPAFESDIVFSRHITLSGTSMLDFIKYVAPKLQNISGPLLISDAPATPTAYKDQVSKQGWEPAADFTPEQPNDNCEININFEESGEISLIDEDESDEDE